MPAPIFTPAPLGVGLLWSPAVASLLATAGTIRPAVIALSPQTLWRRGADGTPRGWMEPGLDAPETLTLPRLMRSAGLTLATSTEWCPHATEFWRRSVQRMQPAWVSEDLAFSRVAGGAPDAGSRYAGAALPALQCVATVLAAVRRIESLRRLGVAPLAFRNVANHLLPQAGEMHDGDFLAAVADASGSGIVLDLHALWVNERSGRARAADVIARLPLHRVWEIHLASCDETSGEPGRRIPAAMLECLTQWLPRMPRVGALILDPMPDAERGLDALALAADLRTLRELWPLRGTMPPQPRTTPARAAAVPGSSALVSPACSAREWERSLALLANGCEVPALPRSLRQLSGDPGLAAHRRHLESQRTARLAECLPLSWRALVLHLGLPAAQSLRQAFWRAHWPQEQALAESRLFAQFLRRALPAGGAGMPQLQTVVDFELACAESAHSGVETQVLLQDEPMLLLAALARRSGTVASANASISSAPRRGIQPRLQVPA